MTDEQAQNLADAIVLQAAQDYANALLNDDADIIKDCEKFFRSKWCLWLSKCDGNRIISQMKKSSIRFKEQAHVIIGLDPEERNGFICPFCGGEILVLQMGRYKHIRCRSCKSYYRF